MESVLVVKIGGRVLDEPALRDPFLDAFAALPGAKVLVHGGGTAASALARRMGESELHAVMAAGLAGGACAPAAAQDEDVSIQRHLVDLHLGDTLEDVQLVYPPAREWPAQAFMKCSRSAASLSKSDSRRPSRLTRKGFENALAKSGVPNAASPVILPSWCHGLKPRACVTYL